MDDFTLAQMRSQYSGYYLPDTCTILRRVATRSATGRDSWAYGTVAASVACRIMPIAQTEESLGGEQSWPDQAYQVSMAYNGTLTPAHVIVYSGGTLEVTSVQTLGSWKVALRAICREVKPE